MRDQVHVKRQRAGDGEARSLILIVRGELQVVPARLEVQGGGAYNQHAIKILAAAKNQLRDKKKMIKLEKITLDRARAMAQETLKVVIENHPNTPWSRLAEKTLKRLGPYGLRGLVSGSWGEGTKNN